MRRVMMLMAVMMLLMTGLTPRAEGGLRDIHPRPQQMGLLTDTPLAIAGTFYLVLPE